MAPRVDQDNARLAGSRRLEPERAVKGEDVLSKCLPFRIGAFDSGDHAWFGHGAGTRPILAHMTAPVLFSR
jgi:hypothetical protein